MENIQLQFSTDDNAEITVKAQFFQNEKGGLIRFCVDKTNFSITLENDDITICSKGEIAYTLPLYKKEFTLDISTPYGNTSLCGKTEKARYIIGKERIFIDCAYSLIYASGEKDSHSIKIVGKYL